MLDRDVFELFWNCGCGGSTKRTDEEIEKVIRETEKEREKQPAVIPVTPERIPAPNWPKPERTPVPVRR